MFLNIYTNYYYLSGVFIFLYREFDEQLKKGITTCMGKLPKYVVLISFHVLSLLADCF